MQILEDIVRLKNKIRTSKNKSLLETELFDLYRSTDYSEIIRDNVSYFGRFCFEGGTFRIPSQKKEINSYHTIIRLETQNGTRFELDIDECYTSLREYNGFKIDDVIIQHLYDEYWWFDFILINKTGKYLSIAIAGAW